MTMVNTDTDIISGTNILKWLFVVSVLFFSVNLCAQPERKYVRKGNREFAKNNFSESEISYRKAIEKNKSLPDAVFNSGDALYKQNKFEDAAKQFSETVNKNEDRKKKSDAYYNLGNSMLKAKKIQESIDAYKESLKLRPDNMEAKYNLSYAQDMLQKQQQQQQQNQNNKDQDKKNDQDKNNKENKDQQKQDQNNDQNKQAQNQQQSISKDDAERLLDAIANDEKEVQKKVKLAKAAQEQISTNKNW